MIYPRITLSDILFSFIILSFNIISPVLAELWQTMATMVTSDPKGGGMTLIYRKGKGEYQSWMT